MTTITGGRRGVRLYLALAVLAGLARGEFGNAAVADDQARNDAAVSESLQPPVPISPPAPSAADIPSPLTTVSRGSSSRAVRKEAEAGLPLNLMSPANRQRATAVVADVSLFRRMPTVQFEVEPSVYRYFTTYPEVAVSIWRVLGLSTFQLTPAGEDAYEADSGDGSTGTLDVLYRSANEQVVVCSGNYSSPLLAKPIAAACLIHLETKYKRTAEGRILATHRADLFVSLPSQPVETVAKVISPLGNLVIDHNFREVSLFVHMMWQSMVKRPGWVEQLAQKLEDVPEKQREQLVQVAVHSFVSERKRALAAAGRKDISLEEVMEPLRTAGEDSANTGR